MLVESPLITVPPAHAESLSPLKLHKARRAAAQRSAARGQRSPKRVCFSGHVYVSLDMSRVSMVCSGRCTSTPTEERLAQRFGGAISIEIEVQCGAGNPQALRHFCRICLTIRHGRHGHAQRGFRHFAGAATLPPPSPSRRESCACALTDQFSFKFG